MKANHAEPSVRGVLILLNRNRVLATRTLKALQEHWRREARRPDDVNAFVRWLLSEKHVTEPQLAGLLHDHPDHFFLGQYRLLERIGQGRTAAVYRAVSRQGYVVAVKVFDPTRTRDPGITEHIKKVTTLARDLDHLHVVRTLEAGSEFGLSYLVLEHLEGETLQQILERRGRLPEKDAAEIVRQALVGLDYLHKKGLVHRNLEPGNLLIHRSEEGGVVRKTVKIIGLSLLCKKGDLSSSESRTREAILATAAAQYRAPEMARNPTSADIRADIYSLGCVFYHALAGRPPYPEPSAAEQMTGYGSEPPPLREIAPELPEVLFDIVSWMMAPAPDRRYADPDRANRALQLFLTSTTSAAPAEVELAGTSPILVEVSVVAEAPAGGLAADSISVELLSPPVVPEVPAAAVAEESVPLAVQPASEAIVARPAGLRQDLDEGGGFSHRDYWLLLAGGVGVVVAQLIGWLVGVAVRAMQGGP